MQFPRQSFFMEERAELLQAGATIQPGQSGRLLTLKFGWPKSDAYFSMGIKHDGSYEVKAFTDTTQKEEFEVGGCYVDIVSDNMDEVVRELNALFKL